MKAKVLNQEYELVDIDKIQRHPANPRIGQVGAIAVSIQTNGFYGAVAVQRSTSYILAGNHRWEAAKAEGLKQIPVIWLEVDDKTAKRILLADNKTSDLGEYDENALATILMELRAAEGLLGTGYGEIDVGELLKSMGDELVNANAQVEAITGKDESASLEDQFRIVIDCDSEAHQVELLDKFTSDGLTCHALVA